MDKEISSSSPDVWGVIPAAGVGVRMQTDKPKQFINLAGQSILQRSIDALLRVRNMQQIMVVVQPSDDDYIQRLPAFNDSRIAWVKGAEERAGSVANGVNAVCQRAGDNAWVLVHDAARPLVSTEDIHQLILQVLSTNSIGGLLATPVQDTLKMAHQDKSIKTTVDRNGLWQAQTPQMFKSGPLSKALQDGLTAQKAHNSIALTDEASAFERLGEKPLLVEARSPNLKITRPQDLVIAEALLRKGKPKP